MYLSCITIFNIIILKLSYWQEFYLVILLKNYKNSEMCFYFTIIIFGLLISLKVESNKKFLFNFEKVTK